MNEAETRAELIDPALRAAGWGIVADSRIGRETIIAPGRIEGAGRLRGASVRVNSNPGKIVAEALLEERARSAVERLAAGVEHTVRHARGLADAGCSITRFNLE